MLMGADMSAGDSLPARRRAAASEAPRPPDGPVLPAAKAPRSRWYIGNGRRPCAEHAAVRRAGRPFGTRGARYRTIAS